MSLISRAGVATVALAVAGLPLFTGAPAHASAAPEQAGQAAAWTSFIPCLTETAATRIAPWADDPLEQKSEELGVAEEKLIDDPDAPRFRTFEDTAPVEAEDIAAVPKSETTRKFVTSSVEPRLASRVTIPVRVNVIKGKHRGERAPAGPRKIRRLLQDLNRGFAGQQSALSPNTRYRFKLQKIKYTKRDAWHHAFLNGPRDQRMKRKLHRGGARTLNLYINGGGPTGFPVLGWARFPWQYRSAPRLDGVTVNMAAMRGGKARGYNLNDTAVHEVGHWLGLFHTFQGGCGARGDLVADTPAEAEPSYFCETTRDTCPDDLGLDPVHNFMDYSLDSCMRMFTPGQVRRMDTSFAKWRQ